MYRSQPRCLTKSLHKDGQHQKRSTPSQEGFLESIFVGKETVGINTQHLEHQQCNHGKAETHVKRIVNISTCLAKQQSNGQAHDGRMQYTRQKKNILRKATA